MAMESQRFFSSTTRLPRQLRASAAFPWLRARSFYHRSFPRKILRTQHNAKPDSFCADRFRDTPTLVSLIRFESNTRACSAETGETDEDFKRLAQKTHCLRTGGSAFSSIE
jgi:hypothetical protein